MSWERQAYIICLALTGQHLHALPNSAFAYTSDKGSLGHITGHLRAARARHDARPCDAVRLSWLSISCVDTLELLSHLVAPPQQSLHALKTMTLGYSAILLRT